MTLVSEQAATGINAEACDADGSNEQKVGTIQQNPRSSPGDQQAGRQCDARFSSQAPAQIGNDS